MTIHHDKMAYGRIAPLREEAGEAELTAMAQALSETKEEKPMREYDRMIAGELYNPSEPELVALRTRARKLCSIKAFFHYYVDSFFSKRDLQYAGLEYQNNGKSFDSFSQPQLAHL